MRYNTAAVKNMLSHPTMPDAMSLSELLSRAGVASGGISPWENVKVLSLADDSRRVRPGGCFVAVRGTHVDGHRFLGAAIAAGAAAVVAEEEVSAPPTVAIVRVNDSREALARLAAAFYGLRGATAPAMKFVGVTGTNGKTTVAWMLRSILRAADRPTALLGTVEYDLGGKSLSAPLTTPGALELCRLLSEARDGGAAYAVMEVSSHALDQRRTDGLRFDAAVFTNLTGDHLDYHGDMAAYAKAKQRLFASLDSSAVAVLNGDDPYWPRMAESLVAPAIRYGIDAAALQVRARKIELGVRETRFTLEAESFEAALCCPFAGRHNVLNALAAAATAEALGVGPSAIQTGLQELAGVPGRLERAEPDGCPFAVFVDYAHTDDALRNVLTALRPITRGRLLCVFGCGGDRDRLKRPRMARVVEDLADLAIVTSDNPRTEDPRAIIDGILKGFVRPDAGSVLVEADRRTAIAIALEVARPGDTVLIAGKGHEDYQLVGDKKLDFDDVRVARECLMGSAVSAGEGS